MAQCALRKLIDPTSRHYSYQVPGIRANYMDVSHPSPLFSSREQWSFPGWRYTDSNKNVDLPLEVIQNPTPFGYYTKVTSELTPMTEEGQPSALVPKSRQIPIIVNQEVIGRSTSLPDGNNQNYLYGKHGENKLVQSKPQKGLVLSQERDPSFIAPLKSGWYSNRLLEPGLSCTTRVQKKSHSSKMGGAVSRMPIKDYWAQGFKTMDEHTVLFPETVQMDVGQGTLGKRKERLDDEDTLNRTLKKMSNTKLKWQKC